MLDFDLSYSRLIRKQHRNTSGPVVGNFRCSRYAGRRFQSQTALSANQAQAPWLQEATDAGFVKLHTEILAFHKWWKKSEAEVQRHTQFLSAIRDALEDKTEIKDEVQLLTADADTRAWIDFCIEPDRCHALSGVNAFVQTDDPSGKVTLSSAESILTRVLEARYVKNVALHNVEFALSPCFLSGRTTAESRSPPLSFRIGFYPAQDATAFRAYQKTVFRARALLQGVQPIITVLRGNLVSKVRGVPDGGVPGYVLQGLLAYFLKHNNSSALHADVALPEESGSLGRIFFDFMDFYSKLEFKTPSLEESSLGTEEGSYWKLLNKAWTDPQNYLSHVISVPVAELQMRFRLAHKFIRPKIYQPTIGHVVSHTMNLTAVRRQKMTERKLLPEAFGSSAEDSSLADVDSQGRSEDQEWAELEAYLRSVEDSNQRGSSLASGISDVDTWTEEHHRRQDVIDQEFHRSLMQGQEGKREQKQSKGWSVVNEEIALTAKLKTPTIPPGDSDDNGNRPSPPAPSQSPIISLYDPNSDSSRPPTDLPIKQLYLVPQPHPSYQVITQFMDQETKAKANKASLNEIGISDSTTTAHAVPSDTAGHEEPSDTGDNVEQPAVSEAVEESLAPGQAGNSSGEPVETSQSEVPMSTAGEVVSDSTVQTATSKTVDGVDPFALDEKKTQAPVEVQPNVSEAVRESLVLGQPESLVTSDNVTAPQETIPPLLTLKGSKESTVREKPYPRGAVKDFTKDDTEYVAPWTKLHFDIAQFFHYVRPTPKEQFAYSKLTDRLKRTLQAVKSDGAESKIAMDIDINFDFGSAKLPVSKKIRLMYKAIKAMKREGLISEVADKDLVPWARVPVINCETTLDLGSVSVDITFRGNYDSSSVTIIFEFFNKMPALRPLLMVLKQFLLMRKLHKPFEGGLGSYPLMCMIISFLQVNYNRRPQDYIDEPFKNRSLGVLLKDFLFYYGSQFPYSKVYIDVQRGLVLPRTSKEWVHKAHQTKQVAILCPVEGVDAGRATRAMPTIKRVFMEAYETLSQLPDDGLSSVVQINQKVVNYRANLEELVDAGNFGEYNPEVVRYSRVKDRSTRITGQKLVLDDEGNVVREPDVEAVPRRQSAVKDSTPLEDKEIPSWKRKVQRKLARKRAQEGEEVESHLSFRVGASERSPEAGGVSKRDTDDEGKPKPKRPSKRRRSPKNSAVTTPISEELPKAAPSDAGTG
ncbi:hypothetical protein D9758_014993 [Tetrapyrgos nigripes]|uniref:PAP-associated domain-containing protein n=1 Tax=Tetrapyrgos nigripes TaxID=182062 RepID=A0A8H5CE75_9AGAR|nr:hypothetical protein D9758_014993 [Tetrapyrgos nigripes]